MGRYRTIRSKKRQPPYKAKRRKNLEMSAPEQHTSTSDSITQITESETSNQNTNRDNTSKQTASVATPTPIDVKMTGRRLMSIDVLESCMQMTLEHGKQCPLGMIKIVDEKLFGLRSVFTISCQYCGWKKDFGTDSINRDISVNEALAWGTIAGASCYQGSRHLFEVLECHFPNYKTFQNYEDITAKKWSKALEEEISENGRLEYKLAKEKGNVVKIEGQEYPYTMVYCDGGCGKRSYGHTYNSSSGCAVIVGHLTKKILFLGMRNRFCSICKLDENKEPRKHVCFKNWKNNQSSGSMEADILVEGFNSSIDMHKLVYKQFVADGDSSVYINLLSQVDYGGQRIEKIECINHTVKRWNKAIQEMSSNTKCYTLEERKPFKSRLNRFGKALRCAVIYHNKQNTPDSVNNLATNIKNIPFHIFGQHEKCSVTYCTDERKKEKNEVPLLSKTRIWSDLFEVVNRTADLSSRIIHNITSNRAETFIGRCSKYLLGKRINVYQRGMYNERVTTAGLSYSNKSCFFTNVFKTIEKKSPCVVWKRSQQISMRHKKSKMKPKKLYFSNGPRRSDSNPDYGKNAADEDGLSSGDLRDRGRQLIHSLQVDQATRDNIEKQTIGQASNHLWHYHRKNRITASVAGRLMSLRDTTSNASTIISILKPDSRLQSLDAIVHGVNAEGEAKRAYEAATNNRVTECGLFISIDNGILAASPDGLVGDDGIVEIKCPISMLGHDPSEMPKIMKSSYLILDSATNKLKLKKEHHYYKQIIMQLYVTNRQWCDFVVYSYKVENSIHVPFPPFIQRIQKDSNNYMLWQIMYKKFDRFYTEDLIPEIICSRANRNMSIRQPKYRLDAMESHAKSKAKKL